MTCRYGKSRVAQAPLPGGSALRWRGSQVPADIARLTSIAVLAGGRTPNKRLMDGKGKSPAIRGDACSGLHAAGSTDEIRAGETAGSERQEPHRLGRPRLPVCPAIQHSGGTDVTLALHR
jgi:hypothetical protein